MILPATAHPSYSIATLLRDTFAYADVTDDAALSKARPLSVAEPQPIYTATIEALLDGRFLENPEFSGWQYVLVADDQPQGVVEVPADDPAAEPPSTYDVLRPAEYAVILNDVVTRAEEVEGEYELRILRVPSVYLVAVWLRPSTQKDQNWLLPVVPPSPDYLAEQRFTANELTEKLRPLAIKRRDTEDRKR